MVSYHLIASFLLVLICRIADCNGSVDPWQEKVSQIKGCDLFKGSWVYDDSVTTYNSTVCPFIGQGFDCLRNGRPDHEYLKYKWKPDDCSLPSFDGRDFLERHKGKKIMFVGDSLGNNMWESLTCMIHSSVPEAKYSKTGPDDAGIYTFSFPDYRITIMLLTNRFLVDLVNQKEGTVLKLDSITSGDRWKGMDYLIFNTYHWWFHTGQLQNWDYFQVGNKLYKDMDRLEALKIGLTTWSKWIDSNIDPRTTTVFFQGISPAHINAQEWNGTGSMGCQGETKPLLGPKYPSPEIAGKAVIDGVLSMMMVPPYLLDTELLSQLRKDGHPSIYAGQGSKFVDCSHWCLAGVPDTWNQILYAVLMRMEGGNGITPAPSGPPPSPNPSPGVPRHSPSVTPVPSSSPSPSRGPSPSPSRGPSPSPSLGPSPSPSHVPAASPSHVPTPSPSYAPKQPGAPSPADVPQSPDGDSPPGDSGEPSPSEGPEPSDKAGAWMLTPAASRSDLVMVLLAYVLLF